MTALAVSQGGTPIWLTPVIAGAAAILAAAVTAYATAYAARRKVAELRLANSFEQAKQYLESARNYSERVYLPLSVSAYKLHNSFLTYRAAIDADQATTTVFTDECKEFITAVDSLFMRGAAAVLTLRLDETITLFVSFLRESLTSTRSVRGTSIIQEFLNVMLTTMSVTLPLITPLSFFRVGPLLELGTKQSGPTWVAAPIASSEFEEQFLTYINAIKSGIKEVTLGGYPRD